MINISPSINNNINFNIIKTYNNCILINLNKINNHHNAIGGFYCVSMNNKFINSYLSINKPIICISDILLARYNENEFNIKNCYTIIDNNNKLFNNRKIGLAYNDYNIYCIISNTENIYNLCSNNILNNKFLKTLNKINKLKFKLNNNIPIYLYYTKNVLSWNKNIIDIFCKLYNAHIINYDKYNNYDTIDIFITTAIDKIIINNNVLNIIINGESNDIYYKSYDIIIGCGIKKKII